MVVQVYGVAIREAIASNNLEKMKAVAKQAKQLLIEQKDFPVALIELIEAIEKLEEKK